MDVYCTVWRWCSGRIPLVLGRGDNGSQRSLPLFSHLNVPLRAQHLHLLLPVLNTSTLRPSEGASIQHGQRKKKKQGLERYIEMRKERAKRLTPICRLSLELGDSCGCTNSGSVRTSSPPRDDCGSSSKFCHIAKATLKAKMRGLSSRSRRSSSWFGVIGARQKPSTRASCLELAC